MVRLIFNSIVNFPLVLMERKSKKIKLIFRLLCQLESTIYLIQFNFIVLMINNSRRKRKLNQLVGFCCAFAMVTCWSTQNIITIECCWLLIIFFVLIFHFLFTNSIILFTWINCISHSHVELYYIETVYQFSITIVMKVLLDLTSNRNMKNWVKKKYTKL